MTKTMAKIKVANMINSNGNKVKNQFTVVAIEDGVTVEYFQSYNSVIVRKPYCSNPVIALDRDKWDYSVTTGRYRNQFLGETKKETQAKIDSGEYILADLN